MVRPWPAKHCCGGHWRGLGKRKEKKSGQLWEFARKRRMYSDVNDLSQNTRRLNFPERKFTNKEPQITFRCQTENSGESRQFSEEKKQPVQSILDITERKKAKDTS